MELAEGGLEILFMTSAGGSTRGRETPLDNHLNEGEASRRTSRGFGDLELCSDSCMNKGVKRMVVGDGGAIRGSSVKR